MNENVTHNQHTKDNNNNNEEPEVEQLPKTPLDQQIIIPNDPPRLPNHKFAKNSYGKKEQLSINKALFQAWDEASGSTAQQEMPTDPQGAEQAQVAPKVLFAYDQSQATGCLAKLLASLPGCNKIVPKESQEFEESEKSAGSKAAVELQGTAILPDKSKLLS